RIGQQSRRPRYEIAHRHTRHHSGRISARLAMSQRADALQGEQNGTGGNPMNSSWLLLVLIASPTLGVLAVALDRATRRGYGLGAFAIGALVLAFWGDGAFSQASQGVVSSADSLEVVAFALVYGFGELCLALGLTLSAVVEA